MAKKPKSKKAMVKSKKPMAKKPVPKKPKSKKPKLKKSMAKKPVSLEEPVDMRMPVIGLDMASKFRDPLPGYGNTVHYVSPATGDAVMISPFPVVQWQPAIDT